MWQGIQIIMKLIIMQISSAFYHFIPPGDIFTHKTTTTTTTNTNNNKNNYYSVALTPERPLLVGEISANFCR
jgi:hypothetical protein